MAERFYVNCPLAVGPVNVAGPEAHHLATVCRLRPGDGVRLFNGDGLEYQANVISVDRRSVLLEITSVDNRPRELDHRIEVAAPLPKGDRAQFLIEKLTELGVSCFTPLRTARSVVHPRDTEKLQRYVIEASKQCGRNVLMKIEPLTEWTEYCRRADLPELRVLAHVGEREESWPVRQDTALAVGPEGGFTEEEVSAARAAGWRVVGLGPRVLRIETAALAMAVRTLG